jgi:GDP-L-fucose synthase
VEAREAGRNEVTLWGDGSPTREFLYVEDAAEAIVLAAERYNDAEPVNLGTGEEISIRKLAELIAAEVGFKGEFVWDTSKPNGQPRRCLDVTRAKELFGFQATRGLRDGIAKTIEWFLAHRENRFPSSTTPLLTDA